MSRRALSDSSLREADMERAEPAYNPHNELACYTETLLVPLVRALQSTFGTSCVQPCAVEAVNILGSYLALARTSSTFVNGSELLVYTIVVFPAQRV